MINVMGLDLSVSATGVCLPDGSARLVRPKKRGDERMNEIRDFIISLLLLSETDLVVVEDVPGTMKGAAGKVIPMLHGAVRSALMDMHMPYVAIAPSTLKKFGTGRGNSDKSAMILAAYKRSRIEFTDDNECDAWWLYAAGMERAEQPLFVLPLPQRQALDVADWAPVEPARRRAGGRQTPFPGVLSDPFA